MNLEDLVRHPKIWKGSGAAYDGAAIATGFAELDRHLAGGGWPQRALTEIVVDRYGIGELSLLMPALAALGSQRPIVWIAPPYWPYAPALARHGLDLARVLIVFPDGAPADALWAAEQALRSGPGTVVLVWLRQGGDCELRRLQLAVEEQNGWAVLFRPVAALRQRSPAALRLKLTARAPDIEIEICKCRGARPGRLELDLSARGIE